ncbi:protease inhibitor I42 family protein [Clostridium beijerinckii]|uniref:protease inhibitor I42 family protein n=1 Tax=Clostridium beijerinckii TaxID=1520 RepID=UPI0003D36500|nr:protease inhibitor I42 family protein [Clostridium beijerinckii]ALB45799.1 hypothetical protein X276_11260 [Clostridium beijerinckii NRRL B-598]
MANSLVSPRRITVEAGETFCVRIRSVSEGSTGYHWELVYDIPNNIEFLSQEWIPDSNAIGSPGTAVFKFKALYSEKASQKLVFVQIASDSTIADSLSVSVRVIPRNANC